MAELNLINKNNVTISNDIQNFICEEIKSSVREIVGALNRIVSFSRIYNRNLKFVGDKNNFERFIEYPENKVSIDNIQTIVL